MIMYATGQMRRVVSGMGTLYRDKDAADAVAKEYERSPVRVDGVGGQVGWLVVTPVAK